MNLQIVVAAHKSYRMPEDPVYLPVQAGRALHEPLPWQGDDTGDNISAKNAEYCELTCGISPAGVLDPGGPVC